MPAKKKTNVKVIPVFTKARKRYGTVYPAQPTDYTITIIGNKSITITKEQKDGKTINRTFKLGDVAEYDSFNLKYCGEIVKISEKSVTINHFGENHRLDFNTFCWRNFDFDPKKAAEYNAETSMYI